MDLLANLSATYRQSLVARSVADIKQASKHEERPFSPYTEMMRTLQQLRQNDAILYRCVKQEVVTSLRTANQAAEAVFDIRELVAGRRASRSHSIANQLNRLAHFLFPMRSGKDHDF